MLNNSITIIGHVGQTPRAITFDKSKVVKFSVAVKEFSPKSDEDKTLWLDVQAWNGLGEQILKTVTSGREIVVNGRLALSKYSKHVNGVEVQVIKPVINLVSFHLCGKRPQSSAESPLDVTAAAS